MLEIKDLVVENAVLKHNIEVLSARITELLKIIEKLENQVEIYWLEKLS